VGGPGFCGPWTGDVEGRELPDTRYGFMTQGLILQRSVCSIRQEYSKSLAGPDWGYRSYKGASQGGALAVFSSSGLTSPVVIRVRSSLSSVAFLLQFSLQQKRSLTYPELHLNAGYFGVTRLNSTTHDRAACCVSSRSCTKRDS